MVADVDEQTTTGRVHGCRRGQLPERDSEGLHGICHHLLVADGHVHVGAVVGRGGDREQRGDRTALHDVEGAVDQAPLDVLRSPEVRLDPPTQSRQLDYLCVGERRLRLPDRVDSEVPRASSGERFDRELLRGDDLLDDLIVAHLEHVRIDQTGHERLA